MTFSHPGPWDEFPADTYPSIERMLRHPNSSLRSMALDGIVDFGPKATHFEDTLLALVDDPDSGVSNQAISALATIGPAAADVVGPRLLERFRAGKIPLRQFASAAERLELRSPEIRGILEAGLKDPDEWNRAACARAIVAVAEDPVWAAKYLIAAVGKQQINERVAIGLLRDIDVEGDLVVQFLTRLLGSSDFWTRHDAIDALASMGDHAKPAIADIERLLQDKQIAVRLQAAKAIALLTGEAKFLDDQLRTIFAGSDQDSRTNRYIAIETIGELKQMGDAYLPYVLSALGSDQSGFAPVAIETLEAIGTPNAIVALRTIAKSQDWAVRSPAEKALQRLADSRDKDE